MKCQIDPRDTLKSDERRISASGL